MRSEFVEPGSQRWTQGLARVRHDVYHLPAYQEFATRHQEVGEALAYIAQEGDRWFVLPIIVRQIPSAIAGTGQVLWDATSARGYAGLLVTEHGDPEGRSFLDRAISRFIEACREREIVTVFIRLHPLLSPPTTALQATGAIAEHGQTVSIDLRLPPEELWRQTRHNHRRDINAAVRHGYAARVDEAWSTMGAFEDAYEQSMNRLEAAPFWRLSHAYFDDLRSALQGHIHLCVAEVGGEIAAASLVTEVDGIVEYHLAGTVDSHIHASPSKLIVNFVRDWARERGNRCLHLGGSLERDDSLSHFKAGFSPARHPVLSWRIVVNPTAYRTLIAPWQAQLAAQPEPLGGHFPAYRRSAPT